MGRSTAVCRQSRYARCLNNLQKAVLALMAISGPRKTFVVLRKNRKGVLKNLGKWKSSSAVRHFPDFKEDRGAPEDFPEGREDFRVDPAAPEDLVALKVRVECPAAPDLEVPVLGRLADLAEVLQDPEGVLRPKNVYVFVQNTEMSVLGAMKMTRKAKRVWNLEVAAPAGRVVPEDLGGQALEADLDLPD